MSICINPKFIDKIKELDLKNMSSSERVKAFNDIMGNGGNEINLLYEKKLLLKNQKDIFNKFVDDLNGVSLEKKAKMKERIAERIAERNNIVKDDELLSVVKDTLDRKYNLDIPEEATKRMFNLRNQVDTLKTKAQALKGTADYEKARMEWGFKEIELSDVVTDLKDTNKGNLIDIIKSNIKDSVQRVKSTEGTLGKVGQGLVESVENILGIPAKGIKAAWDASFMFRQGLKVLTADPKIWGTQTKGSLKSWTKIFSKESMEDIVKGFKADIVTRDLYQDAIKSKLAIGVVEDFFPTNVAEKIPLVGNLFKASDDSFTMFSQGARMDLFEKYVNDFISKNGSKPSKEVMDSMAAYVNALTGRGGLGKAEATSGWLNQLFFSARYQVANLKTFTDPLLAKTPEVQKIAAKNLATHSLALFGTMTALSAITDVGFDPREKTFGKVRIPNSNKWVDVSGGLAQYISTLVRMQPAVLGKPKYGQPDGWDILTDFFSGKLAPVPGAIRDYYAQRTYGGKEPGLGTTLSSLFVPITLENILENQKKKDDAFVQGLSAVFDILGAGVSRPQSKSEGSYGSPLDLITGN